MTNDERLRVADDVLVIFDFYLGSPYTENLRAAIMQFLTGDHGLTGEEWLCLKFPNSSGRIAMAAGGTKAGR